MGYDSLELEKFQKNLKELLKKWSSKLLNLLVHILSIMFLDTAFSPNLKKLLNQTGQRRIDEIVCSPIITVYIRFSC